MATFEIDKGRTLRAFTNGIYATHEALYELIDNSQAADASEIYIRAEKGGKQPISRIVVSDNGLGMTPKKLLESLKFAGDRKRGIHEISEYGIGMKVASFSLADEFTIVSKTENDVVCGSFLSIKSISDDETFEGPFDEPKSRDYEDLWEQYAVGDKQNGTIIVLDKVEIEYSTCKTFIGSAKEQTGLHSRTRIATRYSDKIERGLKIFTVNGRSGTPTVIQAYDPLRRSGAETEILMDGVPVCATKYNNAKFDMSLTRVRGERGSVYQQFGIYIKIAGISVAVDTDSLLGMFNSGTSHSHRWWLRGEISFPNKAEFDKVMIATSHKHSYNLKNPTFGDWIRDTDFGRHVLAEKAYRLLIASGEKARSEVDNKKKFNKDLVNLLNENRDIYGSSRYLKSFQGSIKGITNGKVSSPNLLSELKSGTIICNSQNPVMASALDKNYKDAIIEATVRALTDGATKTPSRVEESEFRIGLQLAV